MRDAAGNVSCFSGMQLPYWLTLYLCASYSLLAEKDLPSFMGVPFRSGAPLEMDPRRTHLGSLVSSRLTGEVAFSLLAIQHHCRHGDRGKGRG